MPLFTVVHRRWRAGRSWQRRWSPRRRRPLVLPGHRPRPGRASPST